jgi:exonuclease SbcC
MQALAQECAEQGVELREDEAPRDAVLAACVDVEHHIKRIELDLAKQAELSEKRAAAKADADVAGALAQHLSANAFERWLLQEAFDRLCEEGSRRLFELSSGDYSFAADERLNFEIVDHRNADERRSARTLSGGETFLASLALALSLAQQVADLAAEGAARLESMFLDEGFGTLDPETLDTVASTIEQLGAQGRMIGLITHVRDLAERIPVQYQVSKGPTTASVEKVLT